MGLPFSNGCFPFIEQGRTHTQALDPDRWAQQRCILYWKNTNGATVIENLFPDTLPRPVDSLTEGAFICPIGEAPVGQCSLRRSLSRLPCRRHNGRNRVVVSNWHRRLSYKAWAAPATALCALVARGQQYSLAKVTSGSTAERIFVYRIECGWWVSLPGEVSRPRARAATFGHWWLRTPRVGCLFSPR